MTFLATQPTEQRQIGQQLAQTPGDPDGLEPGFFRGSGAAIATGLGRVGAIANQMAGEAEYQVGALFTRPLDELFDTELTGFLDEKLRRAPAQLTASMTPDPYTTGTLGQILYSVVGIGVPAAAGGVLGGPAGAAVLGGAFQAQGAFTDLTQQGVDPNTAAGAALFEGAMTGLGVGAPAAIGGKVALNALLYGPGINVTQGVITQQGTAAWLEARGYDELADRYAHIDAEMIAADVVLGLAFGWAGARANSVPRGTARLPLAEDVDTALAAVAQRHVEVDTAPGIPANMAAVQSHVRNLQAATEALLDGRPVETAPPEGAFVPKPARPEYSDSALLRAFEESGYPELLAETKALEAELAKRGRVVAEEPLPDLPAAMDRMEQRGGKLGRVTDVKIGEEYATARWAVMEADEVGATVTVAENQLRDRTRMASELQVNEIAAKLDPRLLLADVPTMDHGAPTLTADGKVVAGNGRALAIRKAYSGEHGAAYRQALVEAAERYGLAPAEIEAMRAPVLVRVLQQAVDVERAAILSNEGGAMRMSSLEQARVDAGRLPSLAGVEVPESGDFTAASLRDYVRGWINQFPAAQRAALVDANGQLSQEGMTRLRNALLFRAYGDSAVLQRLVESTDPGARNVAQALVKAAPKVVEVKDAIARGELHPLDISDAIVRTADLVEQIRDQGLTVDAWINQLDLFNPGETPTTLALLRFVDANKRSAKAISDLLTGYYDSVIAAGNPGQGDMLGGAAPDATTLLSNAIARAAPKKAAEVVQDTLFRPVKAPEEVRPEAVIRRAEMEVDGWGMPKPARVLPDGDPLLQPRHTDMSPERVAMREALIAQRFAGKAPASGRPVAIVLGGGGASGKGTLKKRLRDVGVFDDGFVDLDPDVFKTGDERKGWGGIPEYRQIVEAGDSRAAAVVHEESSEILFRPAVARAIAGRYNVVLDRTLGDPAKGLAELRRLKDAGYEVKLVGVTADPVTAIKRAAERAKGKDKRYVPILELLKAHKGFARAWELYAALVDSAVLYDNEVPQGQNPRAIAGRGPGERLQVLDEKAYSGFARKGGLNEHAQDEASLYGPGPEAGTLGSSGRDDAGADRQGRRGVRGRAGSAVRQSQGADAVSGLRRELDSQPILAERPDLSIVDDDGRAVYAGDTLAAADVAIARAQTDALGFEAAVNCFLRSAA